MTMPSSRNYRWWITGNSPIEAIWDGTNARIQGPVKTNER